MNTDLPEPLVSSEVDLRDFTYMPLDVVRLRDSDLAAVDDGEVFRAAVLSWCVAWHQQPAASLTDDDAVLARLLGYGRDVKAWQKLRAAGALRGWVKCSDGRLYHPVVADKATEAWKSKLARRDRTEKARLSRLSQSLSHPMSQNATNATSQPLLQSNSGSVTDTVTGSKGEERRGEEHKGEEFKKERGRGDLPPDGGASGDPPDQPDPHPIQAMVDGWNAVANELGLPAVQKITDARRAKLRARLRDCGGLDGWAAALAKIREARWLWDGSARGGWRANIDFLLQESSFTKLMEGAYAHTPTTSDTTRGNGYAALIASGELG